MVWVSSSGSPVAVARSCMAYSLALARPSPLEAALVPVSHAVAWRIPARWRRTLRIALHARAAADLRTGGAQGKG